MDKVRARAFCFTVNLPDEGDVVILDLPIAGVNYQVWQYEMSPTTQKRHIQGYAHFANQITVKTFKNKLLGWSGVQGHIEVARGDHKQNTAYCTKEDTRINGCGPYIYGEIPKQGERKDLRECFEAFKTNGLSEALVDQYPTQMIMFGNQMQKLLNRVKHLNWKPRTQYIKPKVLVYWGETETGKTRAAASKNAVFCDFDSRYPWGHYEGEPVVCIDEFTGPEQVKLSTLLKWLDGYNITIQVPYEGNKPFIPREVYICSNNSPWDWYPLESQARRMALFRRFTVVCNFRKVAGTVVKSYSRGKDQDNDGVGEHNPLNGLIQVAVDMAQVVELERLEEQRAAEAAEVVDPLDELLDQVSQETHPPSPSDLEDPL